MRFKLKKEEVEVLSQWRELDCYRCLAYFKNTDKKKSNYLYSESTAKLYEAIEYLLTGYFKDSAPSDKEYGYIQHFVDRFYQAAKSEGLNVQLIQLR